MSALQWTILVIITIPILFYIGVVAVLTHVRAKITHRRVLEVPIKIHPWRTLMAIGMPAIVVWGIIPLCGIVYDWAFVEDEPIKITEVGPLYGSTWWYATFERSVACKGELRLASSVAWSYPSPDCDRTPRRQMRFRFDEKVPDGAYIQKIQIHSGGGIEGTGGEEVDLDFEPLRFEPS